MRSTRNGNKLTSKTSILLAQLAKSDQEVLKLSAAVRGKEARLEFLAIQKDEHMKRRQLEHQKIETDQSRERELDEMKSGIERKMQLADRYDGRIQRRP